MFASFSKPAVETPGGTFATASRWLLASAATLGLLAALLVYIYIARLEQRQVSEAFIRLKPEVALSRGEAVEFDMLTLAYLPEDFGELSEIAIRDSEIARGWIRGKIVNRDIPAGEFLLHSHFIDEPETRFAAGISVDMRAVSIPVSGPATVSYFVEPGSRVDIVGTFQETSQRRLAETAGSDSRLRLARQIERRVVTRTVLQNVKVLAVGAATTRDSYRKRRERGFDAVTVELSPDDAEKLVFALGQVAGGLTLLLRNPEDEEIIDIPDTSWESLR